MAARKPAAISATPPARPFSPSMKFIALVANSSQSTVTGGAEPADGERPDIGQAVVHHVDAAGDRDDSAAMICAASFTVNFQSYMSSRKATTAIATEASMTPTK